MPAFLMKISVPQWDQHQKSRKSAQGVVRLALGQSDGSAPGAVARSETDAT